VTLGGMRWKNMKMEMKSLKVNSKCYEGLGMKYLEFPRVSKYVYLNLQMVKYLPETQEKQAYIAI
jgi:hypothetical protein